MISLIGVICIFGLANALPNSRIVNGTDAELGEYPYIISLRTASFRHNCGGSILSPLHILTAAHCVSGYSSSPSSLNIQYGVVEISADETNSIQVEKIAAHENYIPGNGYRNDVAVLKLSSPIPLNERAQPINLPQLEEDVEGWSVCTLVGWGLPYTGGSVVDHLQKVNIFLYPHEECQHAHGSNVDEINHVCAGVPEGGKGQCNGDSGGPLTYNGIQVGIVSWSVKPCTLQGYPGVFTRVAHHVDWINEQMETM